MASPNDPAYPSNDLDAAKGAPTRYVPGMTLRAHIATQIAAGICSSPPMVNFNDAEAWFRMTPTDIAGKAVAIADAVIARLNLP